MKRTTRWFGLVVTGLSLVAVTSLARMAAAGNSEDAAIKAKVEKALDAKDVSNARGPWVEVEDGIVVLEGKVKSVWAKNEALALAFDVEEVVAVEDHLEIAFGESDKDVAEEVAEKIRSYAFFTIYDDVNLSVNEGHVVLSGLVTLPHKAKDIEVRASKVMGVQSVTNEIRTLNASVYDDRIRVALTRRIYGNPLFREYAFRANPPIHIVVDRGRVALTGAVRSEVEKRKAGNIARQTFGVFEVDNRLQIGD